MMSMFLQETMRTTITKLRCMDVRRSNLNTLHRRHYGYNESTRQQLVT